MFIVLADCLEPYILTRQKRSHIKAFTFAISNKHIKLPLQLSNSSCGHADNTIIALLGSQRNGISCAEL